MRDIDRDAGESLGKSFVVLARQQGGRHHHRDLLAVGAGGEGGAQRHLGLAKADVAANETVHRAAGAEVDQRGSDGAGLVFGLVIGELGAEFVILVLFGHQARRFARQALGRQHDQTMRHLEEALLHLCLARLPSHAAEAVEHGLGILVAVARQQFEIFHRQEQLVAGGIVQLQTIMRRPRRRDALQPDKAGDAVIDMHHQIARRQRRDFGQEILRLDLFAGADETVAQDVLLADDDQIAGLEALLDADDGERDFAGADLIERGNQLGVPAAMVGEHRGEALARAVGPARHDNAAAVALQIADVRHRGVEDIGVLVRTLGRERAAGARAAVDAETP